MDIFMSSFAKYLAPEVSCKVSSSVGTGCFYLTKVSFALLISRQILTSPLDSSTDTNGFTQFVGVSTSSITSNALSSCNFFSIFALRLKGNSSHWLAYRCYGFVNVQSDLVISESAKSSEHRRVKIFHIRHDIRLHTTCNTIAKF